MLSVRIPPQSVCTTRTHAVHSTQSSTLKEWDIHMTSSSVATIVNCTSPTRTTAGAVSGEYRAMITRTWSGWLSQQRTHSSRSHWRHVVCSWRHGCLDVYVSTARLTDNCCVSLSCRSTWLSCCTALKRHVVRLSSVIEARSWSGRWVNCAQVFISVHGSPQTRPGFWVKFLHWHKMPPAFLLSLQWGGYLPATDNCWSNGP